MILCVKVPQLLGDAGRRPCCRATRSSGCATTEEAVVVPEQAIGGKFVDPDDRQRRHAQGGGAAESQTSSDVLPAKPGTLPSVAVVECSTSCRNLGYRWAARDRWSRCSYSSYSSLTGVVAGLVVMTVSTQFHCDGGGEAVVGTGAELVRWMISSTTTAGGEGPSGLVPFIQARQ